MIDEYITREDLTDEIGDLNREINRLNKALAEAQQARERAEQRFTRPIVCICGSTKFKQSWITENARLTGDGNIVLSVGLWGHHERVYPSAELKTVLDDLHKRKIDLCDWVWVLDIGGYIGDSTKSEIDYAQSLGRPIRYLSQEYPNYTEPIDPIVAERNTLRGLLRDIDADISRNANCIWSQIIRPETRGRITAALKEEKL